MHLFCREGKQRTMLVIHALGSYERMSVKNLDLQTLPRSLTLLRAVLGTFLVDKIHAFGLGKLVDLSTNKPGKKLLREAVRDLLPFLTLSMV